MESLRALLIAAIIACAMPVAVNARVFERGDRLTLVWVTIKAKPGEGLWEACRRVYQRDAYQVRRGRGYKVRCNIDHSRIYDFGERRQNFNRLGR